MTSMRGKLGLPILLAICIQTVSCLPADQETANSNPRLVPGSTASEALVQDLSREVMQTHRDSLFEGIDDVRFRRVFVDALGMGHARIVQTLDGVPVFGGDAVLHFASDGSLTKMTDEFLHGITVDTTPSVPLDEGTARALAFTGHADDLPETDLQVLHHDGDTHLVWRVRVPQWERDEPAIPVVFVDAHDGTMVHSYNDLQTARNRNTYDGNNGFTLPGTFERGETDAAVGDTPVDDAHDNAGTTYDCFNSLFGRDSYDDNGATLTSTAHHRTNYNNAFWNGSQMVYGDGDGTTFSPLSGSFDVVAHELTHAVTDSSSNLIYQDESGALNEAMSDIFGATCEWWSDGSPSTPAADVWDIGDEIFTPGTAGDALRYMDDPTADGSSYDYYPTRYTGTLDNGGVHWNSGIANLAFYLLSQGGTHPSGSTSVNVPAIGIEKAAKIFYRANNVYLTASSNFQDARSATVDAATDLYGTTEINAVNDAWDAVGAPAVGACALTPGDWDYCIDCGPCADGEGDCDANSECAAGTTCVNDVGANYGWASTVDVCESASSCPWNPGDYDYCLDCGPCADGEGDCDSDAECVSGTTCVNDVGANYGWNANVDVCEASGSSCPWNPGDYDYCLDCGPCADGEGDCDSDAECVAGTTCVNDVGANYGWNANVDVCETPSCPWNPGDWNYCRDCGPCAAGLGDCDGNGECAAGTTCVNNVGANYGWASSVDVCE